MKTLIINANIRTMDTEIPQAGAMLVNNGVIEKLWTQDEMDNTEKVIGTYRHEAEIYDADGQLILPGFIDTHNHLVMYSQLKVQADCSAPGCSNVPQIKDKLKEQMERTSKGQWVLGWGYDDTLLDEKRHPTRDELDEVCPDIPIMIKHISLHFAVVNSEALRIAGIDENTADPPGGHFGRDQDGRLNGILYELGPIERVSRHIPDMTETQQWNSLKIASVDYIKEGITTSTEAAVGLCLGRKELPFLLQAVQKDVLPFDLRLMIMEDALHLDGQDYKNDVEALDQVIKNKTNHRAGIDSVKFFQDGSIQLRTAALSEPYKDSQAQGMLVLKQEELEEKVKKYHDQNMRIAIHGNGDKAIHSILQAYKKASDANSQVKPSHRVEHAQTIKDDDLDLAATYNFPLSFFINHVYYWGDRHRDLFLGEKRSRQMNPLRKAEVREILFTLHSDCPVTPISPLFSIWAACTRRTRNGDQLGGDQCISVQKAVESMTIDGARLNGEADVKGSLIPGKKADFITLDKDIFQIEPTLIADASVTTTWKDGKRVYEKEKVKLP